MPTFRHGKSVNVFIDEYDFSSYFNDMSATSNLEPTETTAFGSSAKTYIAGLRDGTISLSGMFEGTTTGTDVWFEGVMGLTTKQNIIVAPEGHGLGNVATVANSDDTSYEVSGSVGDLVMTSAEFQASTGVESGLLLSSGASITAKTNGTSVDNTASTTDGGVGFFSLPVNTRSGTVDAVIQHSSDNSTFADLVTFTSVNATTLTSERVEVASGTTVNRYLRLKLTYAVGTGASTPVVAFVRR
jgi:hypothetical protein